MELYANGKLRPEAFESAVRRGTRDLGEVLDAVLSTQSPSIESTHFLIALSKIPDGVTQNGLQRVALSPENWRTGLSRVAKHGNGVPPCDLLKAALDPETRQ